MYTPISADLGAHTDRTCIAFHAYGMAAFTRVLGLSEAEADQVCSNALAAARNKKFHMYGF